MYLIIYREKTKARRRKGQRLDDLTSCPPRPLPRPSPPSGDKGKAEQKSKKKGRKRENQGEGCRRPLRPFLASPSVPSDVFTVHTIASRSPLRPLVSALRERDGRLPRPLLGDAIATTSPQPRHRSTSKQQTAAGQCLDGLPSSTHRPLPRLSSPPSGGDGRAASQTGREISSRSPCRPSPPFRDASAYMRTPPKVGEGVVSTYQGGGARPCDSKFREILRGCIALNINYLFSPLGYAVQRQYIGEMVIVLKVKNITI